MKQREYLVKIMGLSYDVNQNTKHHVFLDFSGHVSQFTLKVYEGGWETDKNHSFYLDFYLDDEGFEEKTKGTLSYLKSLLSDAPRNTAEEASSVKQP